MWWSDNFMNMFIILVIAHVPCEYFIVQKVERKHRGSLSIVLIAGLIVIIKKVTKLLIA